jgi:hypothetical protein
VSSQYLCALWVSVCVFDHQPVISLTLSKCTSSDVPCVWEDVWGSRHVQLGIISSQKKNRTQLRIWKPHQTVSCFFKSTYCVLRDWDFKYSANSSAQLLSSWLQHLSPAIETGKVISSLKSVNLIWSVLFIFPFSSSCLPVHEPPPSVSKFSFYEGKQTYSHIQFPPLWPSIISLLVFF